MDGSSIMTGFLVAVLLFLLVAVSVIIMYIVKINKEIKKIARTTEKSARDISEFASLIYAIRGPLLFIGTLTSFISKLGKKSNKKGNR